MSGAAALDTTPATMLHAWWLAGAWDRLSLPLEGAVRSAVRGCGVPKDDIDDLVQHVLVTCWLLPYVPENPAAFATTAARRAWLEQTKSASNRSRLRTSHAPDLEPTPTQDALSALVSEEQHTLLRYALRLVPDRQRRLIVLHHLHGRSVVALAHQFALTEGATKMELTRGRQALARHFTTLQRTGIAISLQSAMAGHFDMSVPRTFPFRMTIR